MYVASLPIADLASILVPLMVLQALSGVIPRIDTGSALSTTVCSHKTRSTLRLKLELMEG